MRLEDFDLNVPGDVQPGARAAFERIRRVLRSAYEAITEVEGRVRFIRYNVPPTAVPHAAALPTAALKYVGTLAMLDKNGAANDELYICRRNNVGAYEWKLVV